MRPLQTSLSIPLPLHSARSGLLEQCFVSGSRFWWDSQTVHPLVELEEQWLVHRSGKPPFRNFDYIPYRFPAINPRSFRTVQTRRPELTKFGVFSWGGELLVYTACHQNLYENQCIVTDSCLALYIQYLNLPTVQFRLNLISLRLCWRQ
jgi:hypothetical protein